MFLTYVLHRLYATRCASCSQPMRSHELFMRAEKPAPSGQDAEKSQLIYHVSCFVCSVCQQPLSAGDQYVIDPLDGRLICSTDYLQAQQQQQQRGSSLVDDSPLLQLQEQQQHPSCHTPTNSHFESQNTNNGGTGAFPPRANSSAATGANRRIRTSLTDDQRRWLQRAYDANSRPSKLVIFL